MGPWVPRFLGVWLVSCCHKSMGLWVHTYLGLWVSSSLGLWVVWVSRLPGSMGFWLHRSMGPWVAVYMGLWFWYSVSASLGPWVLWNYWSLVPRSLSHQVSGSMVP